MHYSDGTEAHIGDIVRGRGYNLPYEIVGPVVKLIPGQDSCNIRVETRVAGWHPYYNDGDGGTDAPAHFAYETYEEAGAVSDFELVDRHGWKQVEAARHVWVRADSGPFVEDERGRQCRVVQN